MKNKISTVGRATDTAQDRFNNLYQAKSSFYESAGSFFVSDDVRVSGEYGVYITDKDGNILPDYREYYKTYNNLHYGIDLVRFLTSISRNRKMKINEIQEIKCTKTQADYPMLLCGHNGDGVCGNCRCEPQHGEQLVQ